MNTRKYKGQDNNGNITYFFASGNPESVIIENLKYGCGCDNEHGKTKCDKKFTEVYCIG